MVALETNSKVKQEEWDSAERLLRGNWYGRNVKIDDPEHDTTREIRGVVFVALGVERGLFKQDRITTPTTPQSAIAETTSRDPKEIRKMGDVEFASQLLKPGELIIIKRGGRR